jgi:hypothetical protein
MGVSGGGARMLRSAYCVSRIAYRVSRIAYRVYDS